MFYKFTCFINLLVYSYHVIFAASQIFVVLITFDAIFDPGLMDPTSDIYATYVQIYVAVVSKLKSISFDKFLLFFLFYFIFIIFIFIFIVTHKKANVN